MAESLQAPSLPPSFPPSDVPRVKISTFGTLRVGQGLVVNFSHKPVSARQVWREGERKREGGSEGENCRVRQPCLTHNCTLPSSHPPSGSTFVFSFLEERPLIHQVEDNIITSFLVLLKVGPAQSVGVGVVLVHS